MDTREAQNRGSIRSTPAKLAGAPERKELETVVRDSSGRFANKYEDWVVDAARQLYEEHGLTRKEISDKLEVPWSTIEYWVSYKGKGR